MWPNSDEAFLDVATSIKRALNEMGREKGESRGTRTDGPAVGCQSVLFRGQRDPAIFGS